MIVGLTGKFAAGKGTVADHLVRLGYRYHSLSDVIREDLKARGVAESREALTEAGNRLRREDGPAALAVHILERLKDGGRHIVDSIRNPAEVEVLKQLQLLYDRCRRPIRASGSSASSRATAKATRPRSSSLRRSKSVRPPRRTRARSSCARRGRSSMRSCATTARSPSSSRPLRPFWSVVLDRARRSRFGFPVSGFAVVPGAEVQRFRRANL